MLPPDGHSFDLKPKISSLVFNFWKTCRRDKEPWDCWEQKKPARIHAKALHCIGSGGNDGPPPAKDAQWAQEKSSSRLEASGAGRERGPPSGNSEASVLWDRNPDSGAVSEADSESSLALESD